MRENNSDLPGLTVQAENDLPVFVSNVTMEDWGSIFLIDVVELL